MSENVSRRQLLAGGSLVAAVGLAGCVVAGRDAEEPIEESYDVATVDALSIATRNGRLSVTGEDRETVSLRGEKVAASEDDLESIWLEVTEENGVLDVTAQREDESFVLRLGPNPRVDLEVLVPEDLRVDRVGTRNGLLDVSNVTGGLVAEARNGNVDVSSVRGDATVETRNGNLDVADVDGDLTVETRNGAISVENVTEDLVAETRNGSVDALMSNSIEATIALETRNGELSVSGIDGVQDWTTGSSLEATAGDGTNRLEIETRNGDVSVVGED